jgi:hypothetical protein
VPKHEVKEEYAPPPTNRRCGNDGGITIREPAWQQHRHAGSGSRTLLVPRLKVKEEEDDEEATKVAEYLHGQRLIASSNDPEDCPGYNTAFMTR